MISPKISKWKMVITLQTVNLAIRRRILHFELRNKMNLILIRIGNGHKNGNAESSINNSLDTDEDMGKCAIEFIISK